MSLYRVTGTSLDESHSSRPATHTDYEFVVSLTNWKDHQQTLEDFLHWYTGYDVKTGGSEKWQILTDANCARALATFHLRPRSLKLENARATVIHETPVQAPTEESATFKLWLMKETDKPVFTAQNAGWELYSQTAHGKISTSTAKAILREKFPGNTFMWADVLAAFSKHGGRYTDLYLRRTD